MTTPPKRKGKSFWSRVEQAGEAMEFGMRLCLGFVFAFLLSGIASWTGSYVWDGVAVAIALLVFPVGFLVGFFWLEVKFLFWLILRSLIE
jgi:hypothetical protein